MPSLIRQKIRLNKRKDIDIEIITEAVAAVQHVIDDNVALGRGEILPHGVHLIERKIRSVH